MRRLASGVIPRPRVVGSFLPRDLDVAKDIAFGDREVSGQLRDPCLPAGRLRRIGVEI